MNMYCCKISAIHVTPRADLIFEMAPPMLLIPVYWRQLKKSDQPGTQISFQETLMYFFILGLKKVKSALSKKI